MSQGRLSGTYDELVTRAKSSGRGPLFGYSKTGTGYEVGDLVCHQRYGTGIVVELPAKERVLVLFEDRQRLLVCGR